jgi:hypothetical protein
MQAHIFKAVLAQALLFGFKDAIEEATIAFLIHAVKFHGKPGLGLKH